MCAGGFNGPLYIAINIEKMMLVLLGSCPLGIYNRAHNTLMVGEDKFKFRNNYSRIKLLLFLSLRQPHIGLKLSYGNDIKSY